MNSLHNRTPATVLALASAVAALCGVSAGVQAQTNAPESSVKLGLGLVASDDGYKGLGFKTRVVPGLAVQTSRFTLRGTSAEFIVTDPAKTDFSVNLRADLLLQGYKESDGPIFAGMNSRKPSLLLGVGTKFLTPVGQVWLEAGADATGNSKGFRTEVGLGWRIPTKSVAGNWTLSPYVSAQVNSAKLADYYYGVTAAEAIANRPAYEAGTTTNFNIGLSASTDLTTNLSLVLGARYRAYGSGIRQSPLLDNSGGLSGTASVLYRLY
jgi:MipA family protein